MLIIKYFLNNQKGGTAIIITVMILAGFLVSTLTVSDIVKNGLLADRTQLEATKAYFAAEAGAERIIWELRKEGFNTIGCNSPDEIDFGAGDCTLAASVCCTGIITNFALTNGANYNIHYDYNIPTTTLISTGAFSGANRRIQLEY